jgi:hypothetical protein
VRSFSIDSGVAGGIDEVLMNEPSSSRHSL